MLRGIDGKRKSYKPCYCVEVAANDSFAKMDKNLQAFLSSSVRTQATHEQLDSLTQKIRQYYFNGGPVTQATKKGFVDVSCYVVSYTCACVYMGAV